MVCKDIDIAEFFSGDAKLSAAFRQMRSLNVISAGSQTFKPFCMMPLSDGPVFNAMIVIVCVYVIRWI